MPDNKRQRAVLHVCRERTCWLLLCVVNGGHVCMHEACRDTWSSTYGFSALTSLLLWLCPVCSNWLVNTGSLPVPVNRKQSPGCCWAANGRWLHPPCVLQVSNPQRSLGCSHISLCWCTHTSFIIYEYERLYTVSFMCWFMQEQTLQFISYQHALSSLLMKTVVCLKHKHMDVKSKFSSQILFIKPEIYHF